MEKYFLIEVATGDAKVAGKSIYEYDTKNEAIANYHSKLGAAMKSDLFETEMLMVVDNKATIYIWDSIDKTQQ